jgi:hypothetical protein
LAFTKALIEAAELSAIMARRMRPERSTRLEHAMNRRFVLLLSVTCCGAILAAPAGAMRLTKSKLIVNVLSVDRESSSRREYSGGVSVETTKFLAKAQIQEVLVNEHALSPGAFIEIRYDIDVRQPQLSKAPDRGRLNPGETATIWIGGDGNRFRWLR